MPHPAKTSDDDAIGVLIGIRIQIRRRALGLTQTELAVRLGVRPSTVHHWELGDKRLYVGRLVAIADALGVKPSELLRDIDAARALTEAA